jgi:ribosomal protein L7/L12
VGWKNVKEAYNIGHIVCVSEGMICIGSPYIHDIIKIDMDGKIVKEYGESWGQSNEDLMRYQTEMKADPAKLKALIAKPDTFNKSIPVYTYDGAEILEKQCEETGWPNCTHDGLVMYENMYSTKKAEVIKWAKKNAKSGIQFWKDSIERAEKELEEKRGYLKEHEEELKELESNHA